MLLISQIVDFVVIGHVAGVHGLKGEIKVWFYPGNEAMLTITRKLKVGDCNRVVSAFRPHKKVWLLQLEGLEDRTCAELLRQQDVSVERCLYDTYFADIPLNGVLSWEGRCVRHENGTFLGKVNEIIFTGSNDVISVVNERGDELLLPVIDEVILQVNAEEIIVKPQEVI